MKPIRALNHSTTLKRLAYRVLWSLRNQPSSPITSALDSMPLNTPFMCIGANDGLSGNPLAKYIQCNGWRGMLVEPHPNAFARLQRNYRHNNVQLVNCAVSDKNETKEFFYLRQNSELAPGYDQIGSFDASQLVKHEKMFLNLLWKHQTSSMIDCLDIVSLMGHYHYLKPKVLLVDTEGHDAVVISQLDDIGRPALVIYEHEHLTPFIREQTAQSLTLRGYAVAEYLGDTIARL